MYEQNFFQFCGRAKRPHALQAQDIALEVTKKISDMIDSG